MVQRAGSAEDRRTVILEITDAGRRALDGADRAAQAFDRDLAAVVGVDASATVRAIRQLLVQYAQWTGSAEA